MKILANRARGILLAISALSFGGLLSACVEDDNDPLEETGESIDDAADEIDEEF